MVKKKTEENIRALSYTHVARSVMNTAASPPSVMFETLGADFTAPCVSGHRSLPGFVTVSKLLPRSIIYEQLPRIFILIDH